MKLQFFTGNRSFLSFDILLAKIAGILSYKLIYITLYRCTIYYLTSRLFLLPVLFRWCSFPKHLVAFPSWPWLVSSSHPWSVCGLLQSSAPHWGSFWWLPWGFRPAIQPSRHWKLALACKCNLNLIQTTFIIVFTIIKKLNRIIIKQQRQQ